MFGSSGYQNPNKDIPVENSPSETVSSLSWSPTSNLLAAGSWDNKVYLWEVQSNGRTVAKALTKHEAPVLCTDFHHEGTKVFSSSCDKTVKLWNFGSNQTVQVAAHDKPIKQVHWIPSMNVLLTGSWDKTLKYWDLRQQRPVASVNLPERVYCMDVAHPLVVVGCAERKVLIYHLSKPQEPYLERESALKFQSRTIACFPDKQGYALGSIEGRVSIAWVDKKQASKDFQFKCHRWNNDVFAVNVITFHKRYGTFATCGSDGQYVFWDKDSKHRLKPFERMASPITAAQFNKDGNIFAYAIGYDWSKGFESHDKSKPNSIYLHGTPEAEIRPRAI